MFTYKVVNVYKLKQAFSANDRKAMKLACIWKLVWNLFGPNGRYLMVKTCWLIGLMCP